MTVQIDAELLENEFETPSLKLTPYWKVTFSAPTEDMDRIFDEIIKFAPLVQGKTDRNAYLLPEGYEYYRPLEGTPTGAEDETRKRPGVKQMQVVIPQNREQLTQVIEAIYAVHSYYEPPICVEAVLRSETKGIDDSDNPHRWWNKDGDWKKD